MIGRITGHRVRLRKQLSGENSFQTVLLGTLEPRAEGTVVRCRVGMHPGVAGCMVAWTAAAGLGAAALAVNLARGGVGGNLMWAVGMPLLAAVLGGVMVAFGGLLVWLGRQLAGGEDVFLVAFVADVVTARTGQRPNDPAQQPPAE